MPYPNVGFWSALDDGRRVPVGDGKHYVLSVIDCGFLVMPTGRLVACDPFATLQKDNDLCLQVPPGRYRVLVTLADVNDANDGSHIREAYATLMLDETAAEAARRIITPSMDGACPPEMDDDGTYYGFPVDAGTACFVDQGAIDALMPDGNWYEDLFDNGTPTAGLHAWMIQATSAKGSPTFRYRTLHKTRVSLSSIPGGEMGTTPSLADMTLPTASCVSTSTFSSYLRNDEDDGA
jgi:Protein of unknown function (DUF4241)